MAYHDLFVRFDFAGLLNGPQQPDTECDGSGAAQRAEK
jgi:hypothetical protein